MYSGGQINDDVEKKTILYIDRYLLLSFFFLVMLFYFALTLIRHGVYRYSTTAAIYVKKHYYKKKKEKKIGKYTCTLYLFLHSRFVFCAFK